MTYPTRVPYFAQKFIRSLLKTCVANVLGQDSFVLLVAIAATEDAKRYRGPVSFHTGQLLPLLGFGKWERLDAARRKAVDAGWLHYIAPRTGARGPGLYWVAIPTDAGELPDTPLDEKHGPIEAAYVAGYEDAEAGRPRQYPAAGDCRTLQSPGNGYGEGDGQGYGEGELPILFPTPIPSCPGSRPDEQKPKPARRQPAPEDLATAEWLWAQILVMQPDRKAPDLGKWADTIRLMRERDGRTQDQIRDLFHRVQADRFWRLNILSPDKLRAKWDDLALKLGGARAPAPSIYKELRPA